MDILLVLIIMKRKADTSISSETKLNKLQKVEPISSINRLDFYELDEDRNILEKDRAYLKPTKLGAELIARYYALKYGSKITLVNNHLSIIDLISDKNRIPQNSDYREAFMMDMDKSHGWPVFYIKENNEEALLIADSLGFEALGKKLATDIQKKMDIDIYFINEYFQSDMYSCFTHCLVLGRDFTAFNHEKNNYQIENLLDFIIEKQWVADKKHFMAIMPEIFLMTLLPDSLLKTCQLPDIVKKHKEQSNPIIHKKETLRQFRDRYTRKNFNVQFFDKATVLDWYDYPRQKGLKLAKIIHIQYFLEQLNDSLGHRLTKEEQLSFLSEAKLCLDNLSNLSMEEKLEALVKKFLLESVENKIGFVA